MERHAILTRTPKGETAIRERTYKLDQRSRVALILVDGKSTLAELEATKGAGFADLSDHLCRLLEEGFVSLIGAAGKSTNPLKEELIAIAREVLGDHAERVVAKLRAAPDEAGGIREVVNSCKKMVKLLIDEGKAEELTRRCTSVLDKL